MFAAQDGKTEAAATWSHDKEIFDKVVEIIGPQLLARGFKVRTDRCVEGEYKLVAYWSEI